jgi:hypothetical protein
MDEDTEFNDVWDPIDIPEIDEDLDTPYEELDYLLDFDLYTE